MSDKDIPKPVGLLSLASLCKRVIATNLERYPAESFASLAENEWESVVRFKHKMTAPKIITATVSSTVGGNLFGDGRKKPVMCDKEMIEIESKNPHLNKSKVIDAIVWKDCTDFRFKRGGPSRPLLLELPWSVQVSRMERIAKELILLLKEPQKEPQEDGNDDVTSLPRTNRLRSHIHIMISAPMCIPLLSSTGIGKAVKKFIKMCKGYSDLPTWFPDIHSVHDIPNPAFRGKSLLEQTEILLGTWKVMASASGAATCTGRERNTSEEQHIEDLEAVQQCVQWRDLFHALNRREQMTIKTRGAKMRKIREDMKSDRHTVQATNTKKKMGNRKLGEQLLYGDSPQQSSGAQGGGGGGGGGSGLSKLGQLRQASAMGSARIAGKSAPTTTSRPGSGFSSSVASSSGQKRKLASLPPTSVNGHVTNKNKRVFTLKDGMKMKLPNAKRRF